MGAMLVWWLRPDTNRSNLRETFQDGILSATLAPPTMPYITTLSANLFRNSLDIFWLVPTHLHI